MDSSKINEMLQLRFGIEPEYPKKRRIIFWYDEEKAFEETVEKLTIPNLKILKISKGEKRGVEFLNNIFKIKYTVEMEDIESDYLIYSPYKRPQDKENWLLDMELYSELFSADRVSMIIDNYGFDRYSNDIRETVRENLAFFDSKERRERFEKRLPENPTGEDIKMAVFASLSRSSITRFENILRDVLVEGWEDNPKYEDIKKWSTEEKFWEEITNYYGMGKTDLQRLTASFMITHFYHSVQGEPAPQLENYYVKPANNLYVFASQWMNDNLTREKYFLLSKEIEKELRVRDYYKNIDMENLIEASAFESIDIYVIEEIIKRLKGGLSEYDEYREWIHKRKDISIWQEKYRDVFTALLSAMELFKWDKIFTLESKDREDLFNEYTTKYYKIDRLYREFYEAYDRSKNSIGIDLDDIRECVERFYVRRYLDPLSNEWSSFVENQDEWRLSGYNLQKDFYSKEIGTLKDRVVVFVSDAMRYEVADEVREKILLKSRSSKVELESMLGAIPSYTKLGMASLLPHKNDFRYSDGNIFIGEKTTEGFPAREDILRSANPESIVLNFDDLKKIRKDELREVIKGKEVIYIYHDRIDALGDKQRTEISVFEGCRMAVEELSDAAVNLSNRISAANIYITSDHGFLYQRDDLEQYDKIEFEGDTLEKKKRYLFTEHPTKALGCIDINLEDQLPGMRGVFPKGNYRFKTKGGGSNFVHGGISLQEVCIPLLKFKPVRGKENQRAEKVNYRFVNSSRKLTSNTNIFRVYQLEAVDASKKIIPRSIKLALYDEGVLISDEQTVTMNSVEENSEYRIRLTLKGGDFQRSKDYSLVIKDSESGDILEIVPHKINISIVNEFEF
jgi:uncharacterized protein (TIGR02687 family)